MVSDHILIVDDEAPIRQILARWIESIGYKTIEAESAEAGLEAMNANPAAVVFCDVQMPGQGGLWLAGVLRAQFPQAAIVLATGVTNVPATTSLRPGIIDYLTKPFDGPAVRKAVERAMAWHDAAVASGPRPSQSNDEGADLQAWLDSLE
ncbi:MAG TPA: response regulator [Vicinamibacterales bacterium]